MAITTTFTLDERTIEKMKSLVENQIRMGNKGFNKSMLIRVMVQTFFQIQNGGLDVPIPVEKIDLAEGGIYFFKKMGFTGFMYYLIKEGYSPTPPSPEAEEIDKEICNTSDCPECSFKGLYYRPFTKDGSYRAFAVCPSCQWYQEF